MQHVMARRGFCWHQWWSVELLSLTLTETRRSLHLAPTSIIAKSSNSAPDLYKPYPPMYYGMENFESDRFFLLASSVASHNSNLQITGRPPWWTSFCRRAALRGKEAMGQQGWIVSLTSEPRRVGEGGRVRVVRVGSHDR